MGVKLPGKNILLYIEDAVTPGQYNLVAGMQANSAEWSKETVDVTDKQSAPDRTLADFGVRQMSVSGNGVTEEDTQLLRIEDAFQGTGGAIFNFRIEMGLGTQKRRWQGPFAIASFSRTGEYNGADTFSLSLESAGVITRTNKVP